MVVVVVVVVVVVSVVVVVVLVTYLASSQCDPIPTTDLQLSARYPSTLLLSLLSLLLSLFLGLLLSLASPEVPELQSITAIQLAG